MTQAVHARLDAQFAAGRAPAAGHAHAPATATVGDIRLTVHEDLAAIEKDWRAFEQHADGTVFQTFDWLSAWQRHVGALGGVTPAVVAGRDSGGALLFLIPLATRMRGPARELSWLGSDLCDYNAPMLAPGIAERLGRTRFLAVWKEITGLLQFDFLNLTKMPERVGAQTNPMRHLGGAVNPSGAYLTHLMGDWETFYNDKRSSATRRRDRTKRKRLGEFGEVKFVNTASPADTLRTLDTLMEQKARSFARMGVANLFAKPGYADFYRAIAGGAAAKNLVHISRLDVGTTPAAINLGLTWRDCYYHLLASYDDGEVSRFGPGAAHLHDLMHYAIDRKLHIFDFTIGDERYKRDWCDTELKLYDYIAPANGRGALVAVPMLAMLRAKRFIKQTPVLWSVFSRGRELLGSLRGKAGG